VNTNDQFFQPGDKVMRVSAGEGTPSTGGIQMESWPQYGVVYCVEDFYAGPRFNAVMLVGFSGWRYHTNGTKIGWAARAFRKVEEIKLCVAAAAHAKKTEEIPA
jgi:hypothetical protein